MRRAFSLRTARTAPSSSQRCFHATQKGKQIKQMRSPSRHYPPPCQENLCFKKGLLINSAHVVLPSVSTGTATFTGRPWVENLLRALWNWPKGYEATVTSSGRCLPDRDGGKSRGHKSASSTSLLKFPELFFKFWEVYSMHHKKLAIQMKDRNVKFIPFIPGRVFGKGDIHLL